ncbi:4a-hydroxytetrahydrobiopterin dehydratase [Paenibacillus sp. CC-CFT747]|nr:4a-hydroxytetrahydrobiopterin dehydratase [Paenibacillus sp. CC-CFT747]
MSKLSEEQISVYLGKLPHWKYEDNALHKTFELAGFPEAIDFVNRIAEYAEKDRHHPDLLIRYRKVTVTLTTHESHGVTGKDFLLAQQIEDLKAREISSHT